MNNLPVLFNREFAKMQVYWKTLECDEKDSTKSFSDNRRLAPVFCDYCLEIAYYEYRYDNDPELPFGMLLAPTSLWSEEEINYQYFIMCVKCQKIRYDKTIDELDGCWE